MATDGETFRAVLAQWPSGVVIVTTGAGDGWHGMTASSFSSVSLDPPMVLICLARDTRTHRLVSEHGAFAVSILGRDQAAIGRRFAGRGEAADRFAGARWEPGPTGSPVLADSIGWLDCRVEHAYPGGDHTIFVGEVLAAATPRRVAPVLFHSRTWSRLADPLPDRITVADIGLLAALRARDASGATLAGAARMLRAAGTRVRLFDGYGEPPPPEDLDPATASALITDPAQVTTVAEAGVGVAEFAVGDSADGAAPILEAARRAGLTTVGYLPDAFAPEHTGRTLTAAARLAELGCDEIGLRDGPQPATPVRVRDLLQDACAAAEPAAVRVALRERRGIGLVNALVAMKSGVRHFDTTLGGVDGALPAEDVLMLAGQLDVASAVDRDTLIAGAARLDLLPVHTCGFAS